MATVKDLIHIAEQDLRIIQTSDSIRTAYNKLCTSRNRMIVACDEKMKTLGVLTKSDILTGIHLNQYDFDIACESLVNTKVVSCRLSDGLDDVWSWMSARNLNAMPVLNEANEPIGVLSSKCVLVKLLSNARDEDALMRDYISGMGYQ